jgi:hypothetical protein
MPESGGGETASDEKSVLGFWVSQHGVSQILAHAGRGQEWRLESLIARVWVVQRTGFQCAGVGLVPAGV